MFDTRKGPQGRSAAYFVRARRVSRFPRWRVWNRVLARATEDIGTLWGAVLMALAFAFVGAFVVLSSGAGWGTRFIDGVGVAVSALIGAWGLLLARQALRYWRRGDPVWQVAWNLREEVHESWARLRVNGVSLVCDGHPPLDVSTLGHVEAVVRLPDGAIRQMAQEGMGGSPTTLWFAPAAMSGAIASGLYEVRWYGTTSRRKRYEIARSRYSVK